MKLGIAMIVVGVFSCLSAIFSLTINIVYHVSMELIEVILRFAVGAAFAYYGFKRIKIAQQKKKAENTPAS